MPDPGQPAEPGGGNLPQPARQARIPLWGQRGQTSQEKARPRPLQGGAGLTSGSGEGRDGTSSRSEVHQADSHKVTGRVPVLREEPKGSSPKMVWEHLGTTENSWEQLGTSGNNRTTGNSWEQLGKIGKI